MRNPEAEGIPGIPCAGEEIEIRRVGSAAGVVSGRGDRSCWDQADAREIRPWRSKKTNQHLPWLVIRISFFILYLYPPSLLSYLGGGGESPPLYPPLPRLGRGRS